MKYFFIVGLILVSLSSSGQETEIENSKLGYASYNFSKVIKGDIMPSNGTYASLGLNLLYPLKKQFLFGIVVDYRAMKMMGTNRHFKQLTTDINHFLISDFDNPLDSTVSFFISQAFNNDGGINSGKTIVFWGSYLFHYGFMISPYPNKYGGLMLQIKRGVYIFPIYGSYGNPNFHNGENENITLGIPTTLHLQLTCKPLTFFKKRKDNYKSPFRNHLLVSVFYEEISLRKARIDSKPWDKYFDPKFFEKNDNNWHFGLKISYGIY